MVRLLSCLASRSAVTIFVALALLWGSVIAPAHATVMAMDAIDPVAVATSHSTPKPCPMSMAGHDMGDDAASGDSMMGGMRGDMSCCPPPGLTASARLIRTSQIVIDIPQEAGVMTFAPLSIPGVDPHPPKG